MKSSAKSKIIILITLVIFFALLPIITSNLSLITSSCNRSSEYSDDIAFDNENLKIAATSGKIHIDGNSGWVDFKNDGNCTGEGTYSEPYIIQGLVINGESSGSGIWIENSNAHFKVENCTLYNSGTGLYNAGIKLRNVLNVQLINNDC